jgi:2-methylcitrate dehydratase PrpD
MRTATAPCSLHNASQSGVIAALLAAADFPAAGEVFQGSAGFFQTFYQQEGDYAALLDQLGSRFEIVLVGPKPFPSCRYTHCAVTGCLDLLRKHSIKASDIEEVRVQIGERDMRSVGGWSEDEKKRSTAQKAWSTRSSAFLTRWRRHF